MIRTPLAAIGVLALGASSFAQTTSGQFLPVMNQKDAGTFHVATKTWTRPGAGDRAWNDIIFDNSCSVGFYGPRPITQRIVEDGRIPSTSSPNNPGPPISAVSWQGTMDSYTINYFEVAYCTFDPLPTMEFNFWECFTNCSDSTLVSPSATFVVNNMPGSGSGQACWTVGIDLANGGGAFAMNADCDGTWDNGGDTFGWSWQQVSASTGGTPGPIIKGDPKGYLNGGPGSSGCDFGANTVFYGGSDINNTEGTGLTTDDSWERDSITTGVWVYAGCWWYGGYFSGNLYGSFHMRVGAESGGGGVEPGFAYCPGDGTGTQCPCANNSAGPGGCDWSTAFPTGAVLTASGSAVWGNNDTFLHATAIENNFGIFFGANNQTNGGAGNPLNDGLRCAGGGLVRLTAPTAATGNMADLPAPIQTLDTGGGAGVTRRYQYWFRTPGGPCGTLANLTNGYEIAFL